jgi:type II secretory pathway component PulF
VTDAKDLPRGVHSAAARFRKQRAKYYEWLATRVEASKGGAKLQAIFENDAERYPKLPRGTLSSYWAAEFMSNGGNLAETWDGTLPDDEVTIIRISQDMGDDALLSALRDVARAAQLSDKVKSAVWGTLIAGVFGVLVAAVMVTIFPIFAAIKLQEIYSFIPLEFWGPKGQALVHHSERVMNYGLYVVLAVALALTYLHWTMNNLVGDKREWLDQKIVLYRIMRDIRGAMFLATMSTLTRRRSNIMLTLKSSLDVFVQSARSAWLRWRVQQVVDRIDQMGGTDVEPFNTNLLSRDMFYFLRDTAETRGFADGFEETGRYVENSILDGVLGRMVFYRWILLLLAVLTVVGVVGWMLAIPYEMKGVMQSYFTSR